MKIYLPSRMRMFLAAMACFFGFLGLWLGTTSYALAASVDVWWPKNNVVVSGTQPFKAMLQNVNVNDYDMFWQVDGGQSNKMDTSLTDYPHKEVPVNLSGWTWRGAGPYTITFKAVDKNGTTLGQSSISITTSGQAPQVVVPTTTTSPAVSTPIQTSSVTGGQTVVQTTQPVQPVVTQTPQVVVSNPANNAWVSGTLTFRASVNTLQPGDYSMYWQVDGGQQNPMQTNGSAKEASVNVSGWSWRGSGPYKLTFGALKNGSLIASTNVMINIGSGSSQVSQTLQTATQTVAQPQPSVTTNQATQTNVPVAGNPLSGLKFYVNPNSNAKRQADSWRASRPQDAAMMDKIAASSEAVWLGGWNANVGNDVRAKIADAKSQGSVPVFIAYNIPNRDCGQYSAGGVSDRNAYASWIGQIASGLGGGKAVVVLEPDALSLTDCLSSSAKTDRFAMLSDAVSTLKSAGAVVYIDAGHPGWIGADDMASRLNQAGIAKADGFALNVSNFYSTADNISLGSAISSKVGGKHFVIDTARNGNGPAGTEWCNPAGRALGTRSTANTGNSTADAFLWLKNPGESDGNCNGGPSAGVWWPEYALGLAERAAF